MSTLRSTLLPLLLLASILPLLPAECLPPPQKALLTQTFMKRSARFGIPPHSLACIAAVVHNIPADPHADPPCYDQTRLATAFTTALVDCLDALPPGPDAHVASADRLADVDGAVREDAGERDVADLRRNAQEALHRIAQRNGGGSNARFRKCVKSLRLKGVQNAHRRCLGELGLNVSDSCHCFSGCHFCCLLKGLAGGFDSCLRDLCPGGSRCN
eukprot:GFKZ01005008.1.p1 GENE.GFKZ01005008.1~~GFKZ01005008.1.p1  ORF type:complete len:249 (+),score=20.98 GFKZ01005008.1:104-748(+)